MMRILIVSPRAPWPPRDGGLARTYHLARELGRHADVSLLALDLQSSPAPVPPGEELGIARYEVVHTPRSKFRKLPILAGTYLTTGAPFSPMQFRVTRFAEAIERRLAHERFDILQIESALAAANIPAAAPSATGGALTVLDAMDVEAQRLMRQSELDVGFLTRQYYRLEARRMARWECRLVQRCAGVFAVSEADVAALQQMAPAVPVVVAPNGADTEHYRPGLASREPHGLLYVGSMNYLPNADAMRWFCADILPRVRARCPQAALSIVGREGERLSSLRQPGIIDIVGAVDDVAPSYARCGVFVVPLRAGGGTRLKILEALACGCAVVSTSLGAEGLPVVNGEHLLIADSAAEFADAVASLVSDPDRARRLGETGCSLVRERFAWCSVAQTILRFYERLLERR